MNLKEFANHLIDSNLLLIVDTDNNEVFRGYAGMLRYSGFDQEAWDVKKFGTYTDIFRRDTRRTEETLKRARPTKLTEKIEPENAEHFVFADLELFIHTRAVIERRGIA